MAKSKIPEKEYHICTLQVEVSYTETYLKRSAGYLLNDVLLTGPAPTPAFAAWRSYVAAVKDAKALRLSLEGANTSTLPLPAWDPEELCAFLRISTEDVSFSYSNLEEKLFVCSSAEHATGLISRLEKEKFWVTAMTKLEAEYTQKADEVRARIKGVSELNAKLEQDPTHQKILEAKKLLKAHGYRVI